MMDLISLATPSQPPPNTTMNSIHVHLYFNLSYLGEVPVGRRGSTDRANIPLRGTLHGVLRIRHMIIPPAAVDALELERLHRVEDAFDSAFVERNHVGVTVHKADVTPVL